MVHLKFVNVTLGVLFCFVTMLVFSNNPFIFDFPGTSFEVKGQNNEGVFSSLSRNFEQTIEEINSEDEKNTATTSTDSSNTETEDEKNTATTSTDSSNTETEDIKSNTADVPDTTGESSNLDSNNSTTTDNLGNKNQSSLNN